MRELIVLVDTDRRAAHEIEALLSNAGYLVAPVFSFHEAKKLLRSASPDLLIAAIRLDAFNGLHIALRSRIDHPQLPIIITHVSPDPVLENEAKRQGVLFVVNPLQNPDFLRCVQSTLDEHHRQAQPSIRRWPRKQVAGTVEAQLETAPARIFDMSYGGLRLAFADPRDVPSVFDVTVPAAGITLKAHRVWTSRSPTTDEFWCGAELADTEAPSTSTWRDFVNSLN